MPFAFTQEDFLVRGIITISYNFLLQFGYFVSSKSKNSAEMAKKYNIYLVFFLTFFKVPYTPSVSVSVNAGMTLAMLFSFKVRNESLENVVATRSGVTLLFSMRAVLLASSRHCLTLGVNGS